MRVFRHTEKEMQNYLTVRNNTTNAPIAQAIGMTILPAGVFNVESSMPLPEAPPFLALISTRTSSRATNEKNTPPNEHDPDDKLPAHRISGHFHEEKQPSFPVSLDSIPLQSRIVIRAWRDTPTPPHWVDLAYTNDADLALKIGAYIHRRFGERVEVRLAASPYTLLGSWP